jgi:hypothetical protein
MSEFMRLKTLACSGSNSVMRHFLVLCSSADLSEKFVLWHSKIQALWIYKKCFINNHLSSCFKMSFTMSCTKFYEIPIMLSCHNIFIYILFNDLIEIALRNISCLHISFLIKFRITLILLTEWQQAYNYYYINYKIINFIKHNVQYFCLILTKNIRGHSTYISCDCNDILEKKHKQKARKWNKNK